MESLSQHIEETPEAATETRSPRIKVGIWPAIWVIVGYAVIVTGLMGLIGPSYEDIFRSADNTWNGAVIPLGAGAVYLIAVLSFLRWDGVFRDPGRLPMTKWLWAPVILMVAGLLIRTTGVKWGSLNLELAVAILCAGVLVGFCEETVFRGILLRGLRTGMRPEIQVAVFSSLIFGAFHFTNLMTVAIGPVLVQVALASLSGFTLYLARRATGLLVAGMVLHGAWDISTFATGITAENTSVGVSIAMGLMGLNFFVIAIAVAKNWKHDSKVAVTPGGLAPAMKAP